MPETVGYPHPQLPRGLLAAGESLLMITTGVLPPAFPQFQKLQGTSSQTVVPSPPPT